MNKRCQGPVTRMYAIIIALILVVSLAGFAEKGKTVVIEADGVSQTVYTHAINKDALMREQKINVGPYDELVMSTSALKDGSTVVLRRAVPVTLVCNGVKRTVMTAKQTAWDAASQYGYSRDRYRPFGNPDRPVVKGMTITIGTFTEKTLTEDQVLPYAIESIPDESLPKGQEKIVQQGQNGSKRVTVKIVTMEGKVVSQEPVSTKLLTEMKPLIRHVGTKQVINTGSLSRYKQVISMQATAYLPTDGNGKGLTRMGTRARRGVVAVDPRVIPLGTKVYIPGYGVAVAEDTGGAILGNRIDLCMEDYNSCMSFGRRSVPVYILE